MKALVDLLLLGSLGLAWCCPGPGGDNIATTGVASQSSVFTDVPTSTAERAIDGVADRDFRHVSCTHTNIEFAPWWRLDLKQRYKIWNVAVSGRSDCCLERMEGLEARVGDSKDNNNAVCGKFTSVSTSKITFICRGIEGRYVSLVIPGRSEALTLCEVEVYGDPIPTNQICF
ncbi:pentraxin fusion protein-like [Mantella aurantiaca]